MTRLRLYQFADSPFCAKVSKILDYKGVEYDLVEVDYLDRAELLEASGQLMAPALTLASGETLVNSDRIAARLEAEYPEPTIFPADWRGIHLALARYFDTELEDALFRAAMPAALAYRRRQGRSYEALWRLVRERKYGAGFCDQMVREHPQNQERAATMLAPLDASLGGRAFLLGRIGYADFALYGQLCNLALSGELELPAPLPNLSAFYERMDQITAVLDAD
ncbi:MAG: glutathione S-transferase family protein [Candidatus Binataceae bacterium]